MDCSRLLAMDGRKPVKKRKQRPRKFKRSSGPDGKNEGNDWFNPWAQSTKQRPELEG